MTKEKKNTKATTNKNTNKEAKVMSTKKSKKAQEVKVEETKVVETTQEEVVKDEAPKANKSKKGKSVSVPQMTNSEFAKLFTDNGCEAESKAKDTSKVVYQQFGTKSRVLQQNRGYQLLLTNGHIKKKDTVLDVDYNDVTRFKEWYQGLDDGKKAYVVGDVDAGRLSDSEFPREKTVKITNFDLLVDYIKYMAGFVENKLVVA